MGLRSSDDQCVRRTASSINVRRRRSLIAISTAFMALLGGPVFAVCPAGYADLNGDGAVQVGDVQCVVHHVLSGMTDWQVPPACGDTPAAADVTCDGVVTVSDALVITHIALDLAPPMWVDGDANQCADACEIPTPAADLVCCDAAGCDADACFACAASLDPICLLDWDGLCLLSTNTVDCAASCACEMGSTHLSFESVEAAAGIDHEFVAAKLSAYGQKYWYAGGMAIEDFNQDGHLDIYLLGGQEPDKLYINNGDGTFTDQAAAWGIADTHFGIAAATADFNGDGYPDIYVSSLADGDAEDPVLGSNRMYRNNGPSGGFVDIAPSLNLTHASAAHQCDYGSAFGDYDLDGDLDLFVSSWCVGFQSAMGNRLFRNDGVSGFTDVTEPALGGVYTGTWGFQPVFADMNGDLYPEILLAADMGTTVYWVNNHDGTFTDKTEGSGMEVYTWGMGQALGDFNNDGLFDWYLTSIYQPGGVLDPTTMHNGNALFLNAGEDVYLEQSWETNTHIGDWGWGASAADFDQDGWLDILAVNGRPSPTWSGLPARIFRNVLGVEFDEVAADAGLIDNNESISTTAFDFDSDGDLDVAISNNNGPFRLFRNNTEAIGNWLSIRLDGSTNPWIAPHGMGAKVEIVADGFSQRRMMTGEPSYLNTGPNLVHFGTGHADVIDEVRITWARGYECLLVNIPANQKLNISAPVLGDVDCNGHVDSGDLALVQAEDGKLATWDLLWADLNGDGKIGIHDAAIIEAALP